MKVSFTGILEQDAEVLGAGSDLRFRVSGVLGQDVGPSFSLMDLIYQIYSAGSQVRGNVLDHFIFSEGELNQISGKIEQFIIKTSQSAISFKESV